VLLMLLLDIAWTLPPGQKLLAPPVSGSPIHVVRPSLARHANVCLLLL